MKTIGHIFVLIALVSLSAACSDDKPGAEKSSGGEHDNAFDRAEKSANEAQQDFQEKFKEERKFVDEKANKAADEGRKAARKVGDAVSGDDEDEEPKPGQP